TTERQPRRTRWRDGNRWAAQLAQEEEAAAAAERRREAAHKAERRTQQLAAHLTQQWVSHQSRYYPVVTAERQRARREAQRARAAAFGPEVYLAVLLDRALPESSKVTPNTNAPAITFHEADTTKTITTSQAPNTTLIEVTSDNPVEASRDINPTTTLIEVTFDNPAEASRDISPTEVKSANPTEVSRAITPSTPTPAASASSNSCTTPPFQGVTPTWTLSDDSGWDDEAETERLQSSPEENDEDQRATPLRLPQTWLDDPGSRVERATMTPGRMLPAQGHWVATPAGWLTTETTLPYDLVAHVERKI
ncbi:hypothetical protein AWZ03_015101, partial [Drosophila navojoa]